MISFIFSEIHTKYIFIMHYIVKYMLKTPCNTGLTSSYFNRTYKSVLQVVHGLAYLQSILVILVHQRNVTTLVAKAF